MGSMPAAIYTLEKDPAQQFRAAAGSASVDYAERSDLPHVYTKSHAIKDDLRPCPARRPQPPLFLRLRCRRGSSG